MSIAQLAKLSLAAAFAAGLALALPVRGGTPGDPVQALQAQVDDLTRQLVVLHNAPGPAAQKQAMQQYWDMLQRQLQYVRHIPGVDSQGCKDWTMLDPAVIGRVTTGNPCPLMSHDQGPAAAWKVPDTVTPRLFELTMQQQLQLLRVQVQAIVAERDAHQRLTLIRQHYETRFQDIQTVRGREWMWTASASNLPDSHSMGAELLVRYCSQCHQAPSPSLFTAAEWRLTVRYMQGMIQYQSAAPSGVLVPDSAQLDLIGAYLQANAHTGP